MATNTWQRYRLSWRLASPLHIGYRTIGTIAHTRLWVPGKNLWGALIDALGTQAKRDYQSVQAQFKEDVRFEAGFLGSSASDVWLPKWQPNKGLCYGTLTEMQLQRMVLSANVGTAIEHGNSIAEEGMLFETEYIAPRTVHQVSDIAKNTCLWLVGHLWLRTGQEQIIITSGKLHQALQAISIGGERAKGYGQLVDGQVASADPAYTTNERGELIIQADQPFPLLVDAQGIPAMYGRVEPVVGRDTSTERNYGGTLTSAKFCWLPGSIGTKDITLILSSVSPGIAVRPIQ